MIPARASLMTPGAIRPGPLAAAQMATTVTSRSPATRRMSPGSLVTTVI